MIIYQNTTQGFSEHVRYNKIADEIKENFISAFRQQPSQSEYNSWANSMNRVHNLLEIAGLKDNHIAIEYEVPYNRSRIDLMLFGKGLEDGKPNVVVIELKQWSQAKATDDPGNFVETYTGGAVQLVPHPSQQVKGYHNYIKSYVAQFEGEDPLNLHSLAYCHNYKKTAGDGLYDAVYEKLLEEFPLYNADDSAILAERLKQLLASGEGTQLFNRFTSSEIRPSKKLLENVAKTISNEAVFSLLDEQLVAKNLIWSKLKKNLKGDRKSVIIVHGGPGTGKSIIALNILAETASRNYKAYWGCKSQSFREGIKEFVGRGAEVMFDNLYRYIPSRASENMADVLFVDEAHRIEKTSNHQYTRTADRSDMPQIDQLIRCAKTSVFFIDDNQAVRNAEIGSSDLIRSTAAKFGAPVDEVVLKTQFRCMGSNDYLEWLGFVLGYTSEERRFSKADNFIFKIFDSPSEMYSVLSEHEEQKPNSARIVAGYCWPWSQSLDEDGQLVKDVVIGDFAMPWETHSKITRPPRGYVPWYKWAYRKEGFKQVGCIYTTQGFEFDYIGVIIADDLKFDPAQGRLVGNKAVHKDTTVRNSSDEAFEKYIKNIYRVLLSRGMKGCYVYFVNPETRKYFENYLEK